jgi:hypothetical protein
MPRIILTAAQRAQLNDWLNGGPTDPIGLNRWLAENPNADPAVIYQAEGERDLYQLLLDKDGANLRRADLTQKMADAFAWVDNSLNQWEQLGLPIEPHQQQMRVVWMFLRTL